MVSNQKIRIESGAVYYPSKSAQLQSMKRRRKSLQNMIKNADNELILLRDAESQLAAEIAKIENQKGE